MDAQAVVAEYLELASFRRRCHRIVPAVGFYLIFSIPLVLLWDLPNVPIRGSSTTAFHVVLLIAYVVTYAVLLFAVVDAVRLFEALVQKLMRSDTKYCAATIDAFIEKLALPRNAAVDRYLSDWIDVEFVARQTQSTVKLIYFPFIVLAIGLIARSQIFDNWYTPTSLSIIFVLGAAYAAHATIRLRATAERARKQAADSMSAQLLALRAGGGLKDGEIRQLEGLLEQVRTNQRGALMPLQQQPLWKALIIPLSGFGGIEILQYFWLMQA